MNAAKVLVVDDEEQVRRLLGRMLASSGHDYELVDSAEDALSALRSGEFALVLCDVHLPGASGLDAVRLLLAEQSQTAVVMISGADDPALARTALEHGAYGYMVKPFSSNEVAIAVDNALRRRALERENQRIRDTLEQTVHRRTHELRDAVRSLESSAQDLRHARHQTIRLLGRALQYRDEETADHIERMSRYCALLSGQLGFDPESMRLASAMHDVGKVAVPDRILRKPGPLTEQERREMERHAETGYQILAVSGSHLLDLAAAIAQTHHERWDGTGYPAGLKSTEIPLEGRIAAVADVFDALTSDRVYRPAMDLERALAIMTEAAGTQFDPHVLGVFMESLDEILAVKRQFSPDEPLSPREAGATPPRCLVAN